MDITKYRRHVVNFENVTILRMSVPHVIWNNNEFPSPNHPSVNSNEAYWLNNNTLCLGYRLLNNPDVFRSIFSHKRQHNIDHFQKDIFSAAEMVVWRRSTFVELFKIKILPEEIIKFILKY